MNSGLATSILRFDSFFKGNAFSDGTWSSVNLMTWSLVEPDVYLIAACLPTYRPLLVSFLTKTRLLDKFTTNKMSSKIQGSSQGMGSKDLDNIKKSSAGFKKLGQSNESIDGDALRAEDSIRLINLSKNDLEHNLGPKEIRVRNDYHVTSDLK